jgi:uncharacterized protein (DUF1330 family)
VRSSYKLAWCVLVGIAIGAASLEAIQAQQTRTAPAYVIAEVAPDPERKADPAAAARYRDESPKTIAAYQGRYLVVSHTAEAVEGEPLKGYLVVIGFDSLEQARGWYNSPAYQVGEPWNVTEGSGAGQHEVARASAAGLAATDVGGNAQWK